MKACLRHGDGPKRARRRMTEWTAPTVSGPERGRDPSSRTLGPEGGETTQLGRHWSREHGENVQLAVANRNHMQRRASPLPDPDRWAVSQEEREAPKGKEACQQQKHDDPSAGPSRAWREQAESCLPS